MAYTYSKISSVTVGSGGSSSIDFIAIPQNYTDLVVVYSLRSTVSSPYANNLLRFNGDTSSYAMIRLYGDGSTASSYSDSAIFDVSNGDTSTSNTFGSGHFYIPNYAGNTYKSTSGDSTMEQNSTTAQLLLTAGLWSKTATINQVSLVPTSGTYKQYSMATLYGIKAEV